MLTERDKIDLREELLRSGRNTIRQQRCPFCGMGHSRAFVVSVRGSVISCWCYRCHNYARLNDVRPSYSESLRLSTERITRIKWRKNKHEEHYTTDLNAHHEVREVWLPSDCTDELPTKARLWLLRYHVTQQEVYEYAMKWSPSYERLILPIHQDGRLVFWTGRYFGDDAVQPKWLHVKSSKSNVLFDVGNKTSPYLVIVEDMLSAISIKRSGYRAFALLGCQMQDNMFAELQRQCKSTIVVWLDRDKACNSFKLSKRLKVLGYQSKVVVTDLDPKEYTPEQIQALIGGQYAVHTALHKTVLELHPDDPERSCVLTSSAESKEDVMTSSQGRPP